jgi:hypothetical protein
MANIPFYPDPNAESVLRMGPSGGALVLVSNAAHVSGHLENKFDDQTSVGKSFAKVHFTGIKPATFVITFVVMPDEEAAFWKDIIPLCRQKGKKGNAPPMSVVNPQINRTGVDTVTIDSADIEAPDAGQRQVTINVKEWTPKPVTPAPAKAKTSVDSKNPLNLSSGASAKNQ